MVSNSKILTVSYGTFSCTLEGFDDSFDTMKAIAEYFRDLAADDRYFGAEPPTPDADMLARIAEKEIARRVEAHEDEGKIHLRADALATPAIADATPAPAEEEDPAEAEEAPAIEEAAAEEEAAEEITAQEEVPLEEAVEEVEATVAQAVVEEAADDTAEEDISADDAVAASIESAMAEEAAEDVPAEEVEIAQDEEDDLNDAAHADMAEVEETAAPAPVQETAADEAEDDDDSVAARLRRIRSVVAGGSSDFESDAFSEDEHAQDFLNDTVSDLDAALMADAPDAEEMPERVVSDILEDGAHDDTLNAVAEELGLSQDAAFDETDEDIEDLAEDTLSQLLADAIPGDAPEEDTEELPSATEEDPAEDLEVIQTRPLRARVIKMKRSDFEAAVADGGLEEAFDVLEENEDDGEPAEAILSPEDEADLQSELDAVAAELQADAGDVDPSHDMADDTADDMEDDMAYEMADDAAELDAEDAYDEVYEDEAANLDTGEEEPNTSKPKGQMLGDTDRPISRLFDEAQSHLSTPEATRRRNAIQHLRAAVEANQAETSAGSALRTETDEDAYRSDIADAMRSTDAADESDTQAAEPRLPTRPQSRRPVDQPRERPAGQRPAPLQLVAEQRVDVPQDPVRPRRVSAAQVAEPANLNSDAESFRDFAEDLGATDLPDLLEAAAAYVSDVEGMPQFSRRMLMGKLDEYSGDDFSREDRLKSFGLLLRHGKLQKLKGGQFTVTEDTDYRTEARDAG